MTKEGHRKISGVGKCLKKVVENLAYREMMFYKKTAYFYSICTSYNLMA